MFQTPMTFNGHLMVEADVLTTVWPLLLIVACMSNFIDLIALCLIFPIVLISFIIRNMLDAFGSFYMLSESGYE